MNYFRKHRDKLSSLSNLIFKYIEISTILGILISILAYCNWNEIYKHLFTGILVFAFVTKIFVDIDVFLEKIEKNKKIPIILQIVITLFVSLGLIYFIFSLSDIITGFELNLLN